MPSTSSAYLNELLCSWTRGQRVIYTTPLKALSNQKLYEMRLRFGSERVGLQTGDATLNADRDIVVMTTEILRTIMYRTEAGTDGTFHPHSAHNTDGVIYTPIARDNSKQLSRCSSLQTSEASCFGALLRNHDIQLQQHQYGSSTSSYRPFTLWCRGLTVTDAA